jgi:hypothetical protein
MQRHASLELLEADEAKRAKLRDTELIALRLYSGKKSFAGTRYGCLVVSILAGDTAVLSFRFFACMGAACKCVGAGMRVQRAAGGGGVHRKGERRESERARPRERERASEQEIKRARDRDRERERRGAALAGHDENDMVHSLAGALTHNLPCVAAHEQ